MDDEKMKELMIDYVEGRLDGELKEFIEKQINKRDDVREEVEALRHGLDLLNSDVELEPDSTLQLDFDSMLQHEMKAQDDSSLSSVTEAKVIKMNYLPQIAAAVALLISGAFIGWWINNQDNNDTRMTAMERELAETRRVIVASLEDQNSASKRLHGVNVAYATSGADEQIIAVLISTLGNDENTNVRLAAARALMKFKDDPNALRALIEGVTTQSDPVVQIELINIMVELKEVDALDEIKKVIDDDKSLESVKDEAHMALFKLS